jgi:hypothetical protein
MYALWQGPGRLISGWYEVITVKENESGKLVKLVDQQAPNNFRWVDEAEIEDWAEKVSDVFQPFGVDMKAIKELTTSELLAQQRILKDTNLGASSMRAKRRAEVDDDKKSARQKVKEKPVIKTIPKFLYDMLDDEHKKDADAEIAAGLMKIAKE